MFCEIFNCQLSITDIIAELLIAVLMATIFVILIQYHITKFRLWKFCQVAQMELRTCKKKKISPIGITTTILSKKDIMKVIKLITSYEKLILDAVSIERSTEIRHDIAVYKEGLECMQVDLSSQVFDAMSVFLERLLKRYKPPRYLVITAKYLGSLRSPR